MEIIVLIGFFGVLLCFWGVYKMKYCGQTFKGLGLLILGMILIFPASILYGIKQDLDKMENEPESSGVTREIKQEIKDEVFDRNGEPSPRAENFAPTDKNWISDSAGVYLWNPEPQEGESITWSGGFVQDGNYKFADGNGIVTWYLNGEIIQVDKGTFRHGQRHGRFSHEFPSGRVDYSNWDNGVEIP